MQARPITQHTQGIACPYCGHLTNVTLLTERATQNGYHIDAVATKICEVCGKMFNIKGTLEVTRA